MGKKGVLLDNGKQARSSMDLYWKAAHNKSKQPQGAKKQAPEEDIQSRAESGQEKWKIHKEKMITKLYEKLQKKDKNNDQAEKERQQRLEQQLDKDLLEKEMNKTKPVSIPGFKNASQLKSKMQFQQVKVGKDDNNKLIPRNKNQELTNEEIIQILREKKAKKEMARAHKEKVQANLRARQLQEDVMMAGIPEDEERVYKPQKKKEQEEVQKEPVKEEPQQYFKSQILQKIERGESLHKKQPIAENKNEEVIEEQEKPQFTSRFIPRALWNK